MIRAFLILTLLTLAACSTVETTGGGAPLAEALPTERIQLKINTGDDHMDALVYELAFEQFSKVMPLTEKGPFSAALEITFASTGQSGFLGSATSVGQGSGHSTGWYTGGRAVSTSLSSGAFLTWQNSTMLAVLKGEDGTRQWSADYSYKGGWEMSGWVVNTPEEAARLIVKRLAARFKGDEDKASVGR
jgi:hypothetical protein